jgi:hypothetical protein
VTVLFAVVLPAERLSVLFADSRALKAPRPVLIAEFLVLGPSLISVIQLPMHLLLFFEKRNQFNQRKLMW